MHMLLLLLLLLLRKSLTDASGVMLAHVVGNQTAVIDLRGAGVGEAFADAISTGLQRRTATGASEATTPMLTTVLLGKRG